MATAKIKQRSHAFTIGVDRKTGKPIQVLVKCKDATASLDLLVKRIDAQRGDPGCVGTCGIAEAIMRAADEGMLPHDAYFVEVMHCKLFVVIKRNARGIPTRALRYNHNLSEWISDFDRAGGKSCLVGTWEGDIPLRLRPPAKRPSQAGNGVAEGANTGSRSSYRFATKPRLRGSARRAQEAGLTFVAAV